jgi:predicted ribonuclease YlaK
MSKKRGASLIDYAEAWLANLADREEARVPVCVDADVKPNVRAKAAPAAAQEYANGTK